MLVNRNVAAYPALGKLLEHWAEIKQECMKLDTEDILPLDRTEKTHEQVAEAIREGGKQGWVRAWGPSRDLWLNYCFTIHGEPFLDDGRTPITMGLLRRMRGVKVSALSLFRPGACLPAHGHEELGEEKLLTFHLCLDADDMRANCLWTEGELLHEVPGNAFIFDGSKLHYAYNCSSADRLILYMEFSPERLEWVA